MRNTWKIINEEKGKLKQDMGIQCNVMDNKVIKNKNKLLRFITNISYL
jgi:hypothetical protein